mmetsp:Transcript_27754/g.57001  ORF Transcript_27754/g.57001 Transcript_27754/m.57001 type:complete len:238 (+) Transcript_27754:546-1259(+)
MIDRKRVSFVTARLKYSFARSCSGSGLPSVNSMKLSSNSTRAAAAAVAAACCCWLPLPPPLPLLLLLLLPPVFDVPRDNNLEDAVPRSLILSPTPTPTDEAESPPLFCLSSTPFLTREDPPSTPPSGDNGDNDGPGNKEEDKAATATTECRRSRLLPPQDPPAVEKPTSSPLSLSLPLSPVSVLLLSPLAVVLAVAASSLLIAASSLVAACCSRSFSLFACEAKLCSKNTSSSSTRT